MEPHGRTRVSFLPSCVRWLSCPCRCRSQALGPDRCQPAARSSPSGSLCCRFNKARGEAMTMTIFPFSHSRVLALSAVLGLLIPASMVGGIWQTGYVAPEPITDVAENAQVHEAGDRRRDAQGIDQVWVPAGCFQMGTANTNGLDVPSGATSELASEQPAHDVCLTAGYWIDHYEVTNDAFAAFKKAGGYVKQEFWSTEGWAWLSSLPSVDDLPNKCIDLVANQPRVCVTWYEAEAYAKWRGGRLPTERAWGHTARRPS